MGIVWEYNQRNVRRWHTIEFQLNDEWRRIEIWKCIRSIGLRRPIFLLLLWASLLKKNLIKRLEPARRLSRNIRCWVRSISKPRWLILYRPPLPNWRPMVMMRLSFMMVVDSIIHKQTYIKKILIPISSIFFCLQKLFFRVSWTVFVKYFVAKKVFI